MNMSTQEGVVPLNIRSEEVNQLADKLAAVARVSKTAAVRIALQNELQRREKAIPLIERIKPIQDALDALPRTGLKADKAFYDSLYDE